MGSVWKVDKEACEVCGATEELSRAHIIHGCLEDGMGRIRCERRDGRGSGDGGLLGTVHINILEGLAFSKTMQQMSPELDGCTIAIWIDNTSVVGVARKGMSVRSQELNGGHQRFAGVAKEGDHILGAVCTITTESSCTNQNTKAQGRGHTGG